MQSRVPMERPTANVGAGGRTTTQSRLRMSAPTADALAFQQRAAARPRSRRRIQGEQPRRSTELLASQWPVARARLLRERRRRGAEDLLVRHRRRRHRAERPLSRRRARRAAGRRPDCALTTRVGWTTGSESPVPADLAQRSSANGSSASRPEGNSTASRTAAARPHGAARLRDDVRVSMVRDARPELRVAISADVRSQQARNARAA